MARLMSTCAVASLFLLVGSRSIARRDATSLPPEQTLDMPLFFDSQGRYTLPVSMVRLHFFPLHRWIAYHSACRVPAPHHNSSTSRSRPGRASPTSRRRSARSRASWPAPGRRAFHRARRERGGVATPCQREPGSVAASTLSSGAAASAARDARVSRVPSRRRPKSTRSATEIIIETMNTSATL